MMHRTIVSILTLVLAGCGGDSFYSIPPPDAAPDEVAAPDARADAPELDAGDAGDASKADAPDAAPDAPACPYVGSVACTDVINAYCAHYASCCQQFPGNGNCSVGWSMASACKTALAQSGYDCNGSKFNKQICVGPTACMNSTAGATCNAIFQSSGPDVFMGCSSFWGQF